jgi:hypothetical protein
VFKVVIVTLRLFGVRMSTFQRVARRRLSAMGYCWNAKETRGKSHRFYFSYAASLGTINVFGDD